MTDSPENSDERGTGNVALAANDRGDGNNVIGISGMTHAEEKAEGENGEKSHNKLFWDATFGQYRFALTELDRFNLAFLALRLFNRLTAGWT